MNTKLIWNTQQQKILKEWAEISNSYRWMHDRAFRVYKKKSIGFALPVIIISTITGTANFSQGSFPQYASFLPSIIGGFNLIAAVISTIQQFLKINELMEGNRVSSIAFGKLARNITVELTLPVHNRSTDGKDFVMNCRTEIDRLIEQSPVIDKTIIEAFKTEFPLPGSIDFDSNGNFIEREEPDTCWPSKCCIKMNKPHNKPVIFTRPDMITIREVYPFVEKEAARKFQTPSIPRREEIHIPSIAGKINKINDILAGKPPIVELEDEPPIENRPTEDENEGIELDILTREEV